MTENERIKLTAIAWVTNEGTLEDFNWAINRIRLEIKELLGKKEVKDK